MSQDEEEYDPSKPYVSASFQTSPLASNPPRLPPPPPTLSFGRPPAGPPPPPPSFHLPSGYPVGALPPPTLPSFLGILPPSIHNGAPPPPGGFPPFNPTFVRPPPSPTLHTFPPPAPAPSALKSLQAYLNLPKSPPVYGPPPVGLVVSHEKKGRVPKGEKKGKSKKSAGGTIQDNLRHALYQDEKYTLRDPVWKVVAGLMTRVHYIETSPTHLPITKLIATKKSDAISMHKRLLEKSTAAIYYSDGSFKNGWAWGAAVEWVRTPGKAEGNVGKKLREELGMCDPTDAELGGMRKALEAFASAGKLKEEELLIFSDSQAAITLLDSGIRYQSQLFISTLERTLTLHPNVKVSIVWIPGHVGITGNELADRTAVAGSVTTLLARRGGALPEGADAADEGPKDMPVILSRSTPKTEGAAGGVTDAKDDSLTFGAGSLFVAGFPNAAAVGDLEVLFGQFGELTSIDIISIPPLDDRFAIVTFADPKKTDEAIQWLDDKPVTLPASYAETRDCEVWKGWQGSLRLAHNEVGRLVPDAVAILYPSLPAWALGETPVDDEDAGSVGGAPEDFKDDFVVETTPHSGQANRRDNSVAFARPSFLQPSSPRPAQPLPVHEVTSSETFLQDREIFLPGPGNKIRTNKGGNPNAHARDDHPPYPPPGVGGRPPGPGHNGAPSAVYQQPFRSNLVSPNNNSYPPPNAYHPPPRQVSHSPAPAPYRNDSHPPRNGSYPPHPPLNHMPATIAETTRLLIDLKATAVLLDDQHNRLSFVLRDPADWSLAVEYLGRTLLREQEALENARRARAKAEDDVGEWEAVLQRNEVGIEERRGFVLDVLDVLDEGVMRERELISSLRSLNGEKTHSLHSRTSHLPPTTHSILHSFEQLFTTLHNAIEDQRISIDEAERRASVLGGLDRVRRDARGQWRGRRAEIDLVVRELRGGGEGPGIDVRVPRDVRDVRDMRGERDPRDGGGGRGREDDRMREPESGYYPPPPPPPMHDERERYWERDVREPTRR